MGVSQDDEKHWTKILYKRFPELYLPILEARKEAGSKEAERLSKILGDAGVHRGRVLDLACGIGRHSIPLAKQGYEVVGYDISPLFVKRARQWAEDEGLDESRVRFHEGDLKAVGQVLTGKDETGFDVVLNMFSSLGSYGEEEDSRMIRDIRGVAAPRSLFIIETLNRDFLLKRFQSFGIHRISQKLRLLDLARFNLETSTLEDNWRFYTEMPDGDLRLELDLQVTGRVYTLHELKKLVTDAGWVYMESFGSIMGPGPVSPDSPSIVMVCQKS
ncbi:MAG: class I SAM-dependent methyltransferase [Thaumarchaeota archaeon]|nr:class I SAM-dependent methyltransferase [Nitrososphaerota archaeon]